MIKNTSYKVQADVDSEAVRLQYQIEEGAYVTTSAGVWTVWNGEWVKLYPQSGAGSGLGWARYDDSTYTSSNKLALVDGVTVNLPNDAASVYRSYTGVDYYNGTRVLADNTNDTYVMTIVFKYSAPNANQTHIDLQFEGGNGTPYDRIRGEATFPKGNDVTHDYHQLFQYYADADFVTNGSYWQITASGGSATVWDIIYFIQKTQSYA
jgi:hypothetical protein